MACKTFANSLTFSVCIEFSNENLMHQIISTQHNTVFDGGNCIHAIEKDY